MNYYNNQKQKIEYQNPYDEHQQKTKAYVTIQMIQTLSYIVQLMDDISLFQQLNVNAFSSMAIDSNYILYTNILYRYHWKFISNFRNIDE